MEPPWYRPQETRPFASGAYSTGSGDPLSSRRRAIAATSIGSTSVDNLFDTPLLFTPFSFTLSKGNPATSPDTNVQADTKALLKHTNPLRYSVRATSMAEVGPGNIPYEQHDNITHICDREGYKMTTRT